MKLLCTAPVAGFVVASLAAPACAADVYKVGVSAGLTGYAAAVDRAWRDGLEVAAAYVNGKGGIMGRKVEVIVEDNKSEPQEAVTVYRKMISSDKVDIFLSGCVSAGNFAAAQFVVRAQIPMVLCSILPPRPEQVHWAYSLLPPPRFEVEKRYGYLKNATAIRKAAVLHDPSPYANLQKDIAVKEAPDYGLQIPVVEQYKQDDADFSPQISKANADGAKALVKIGLGGSTLTVAKNIKQLGLDMLLLGSVDDLAVFRPAGDVLGDQFMFVAAPSQVYDALARGRSQAGDRALPAAVARQAGRPRSRLGRQGMGCDDAHRRRHRAGEELRGTQGTRRAGNACGLSGNGRRVQFLAHRAPRHY